MIHAAEEIVRDRYGLQPAKNDYAILGDKTSSPMATGTATKINSEGERGMVSGADGDVTGASVSLFLHTEVGSAAYDLFISEGYCHFPRDCASNEGDDGRNNATDDDDDDEVDDDDDTNDTNSQSRSPPSSPGLGALDTLRQVWRTGSGNKQWVQQQVSSMAASLSLARQTDSGANNAPGGLVLLYKRVGEAEVRGE